MNKEREGADDPQDGGSGRLGPFLLVLTPFLLFALLALLDILVG